MDQLAAFLAVAATTPGKVTPSLRVDLFRHAFVLRTKPYADFCAALGGGFIHHVPDRGSGHDPAEGRAVMRRTADLIREAGYRADPEFWPLDGAADCTQSYAGCSDSPVS
ncbi:MULTISPECIES: hypothetical protein [unclassified Streptomyces]|uniref:hypothetical protein n=1 Tax=unclassified Streptomyces TaxID=2593676 RepID=UPI0036E74BEB